MDTDNADPLQQTPTSFTKTSVDSIVEPRSSEAKK
jgi:hypothetical protein